MKQITINVEKLKKAVFDAVASKKILKTGYVRQAGGLYPSECDTVGSHCNAIAVIANLVAHEVNQEIKEECDVELNLGDVALLSTFHDYGETKSGDTGAQSIAIYDECRLHSLERDGLQASVEGWKASEKIMKLYDDYRKYCTPEAIVVHIADNLEGFEKVLETFHNKPWVLNDALRIFQYNVRIYRRKKQIDVKLGKVADYLTDNVLIPGIQALVDTYQVKVDVKKLADEYNKLPEHEEH